MASGDAGGSGALPIDADARVLGATLKAGKTAKYRLAAGRRAYLVPARGAIEIKEVQLSERDSAAVGPGPEPRERGHRQLGGALLTSVRRGG